MTPLSSDSIWQPPPSEVRAQRSEEHTHCKSDLAVLLAQVAQVSRDVGLQPQVLSVHSILLEGKDPPHFSFLSGLKGKLSNFDFGCKQVGEPKEFKHFSSSPENTASVNLNKILEMGKGVWGKFEPVTKADIRSIEALHMDVVIFEIYIE